MNFFFLTASFFLFLGCGVKGKPLAPLETAEIGNGRPQQEALKNSVSDEDGRSKKKKNKTPESRP